MLDGKKYILITSYLTIPRGNVTNGFTIMNTYTKGTHILPFAIDATKKVRNIEGSC